MFYMFYVFTDVIWRHFVLMVKRLNCTEFTYRETRWISVISACYCKGMLELGKGIKANYMWEFPKEICKNLTNACGMENINKPQQDGSGSHFISYTEQSNIKV